MKNISEHVGSRIKMYRKVRGLTIQNLANRINKSKATVSKYEKGEITLDIITLYEISEVLQISPEQLLDFQPKIPEQVKTEEEFVRKSPFFEAKRLYFYFYDGRYKRLKDGIIDIKKREDEYIATLSISTDTTAGRGSAIYYSGKVVYSDMLIRFSFVNQFNALEEDLLYIFNPLEIRDSTDGLLCGISSADFMPCAFRCLVTLHPQEHNEELKNKLLFTKNEIQKWQRLNMLIVDNMEGRNTDMLW